ncbi:MAG: hypothetical protein EP317_04070, partial [Bacillota bacterium]
MKKGIFFVLFIAFLLMISGCQVKQDPHEILNPSFESGMDGWSTSHESMDLISSDVTYDGSRKYMKEGQSFLSTKETSEHITISSSVFKVGGTGKITFLISGPTSSHANVSLMNYQTDEVLLSATNHLYDGIVFTDNFIR